MDSEQIKIVCEFLKCQASLMRLTAATAKAARDAGTANFGKQPQEMEALAAGCEAAISTLERSRVRETAKEPPEGDGEVLALDCRGNLWCPRYASVVRTWPGLYTHWTDLPPSPKGSK